MYSPSYILSTSLLYHLLSLGGNTIQMLQKTTLYLILYD